MRSMYVNQKIYLRSIYLINNLNIMYNIYKLRDNI